MSATDTQTETAAEARSERAEETTAEERISGGRIAGPLKVLVFDAEYKHTLGIVRLLGKAGHRVTVVAQNRAALALHSRYCAAVKYAPPPTNENFVSCIEDILKRKAQDLLMPVGYATTAVLAREGERLRKRARLEVAPYEQIRFAGDKRRVQELAVKLGVPVPKSYYPDSLEAMRRLAEELRYPVIVKGRQEGARIAARRVRSTEEFLRVADMMRATNTFGEENLPQIQEYIPGYGCGFFALYQQGVCKRVFMHRRIREHPPVGGVSCCAESFYDETMKEQALKLLDALKWHGVAMVEFRRDERDNEFKLLEINPKFWGSLDLALAAGAEFPLYVCEMAAGKELSYSETYPRGVRYHWPLSGEIQHVARNPKAAARVVADCLNPRVRSNIWLTDFRPAVQEMSEVLQSVWRRMPKA